MLEDKVCVVTGSGRGIGRATAVEMARRGAKVVVSDVGENADETLEAVRDAGGDAIYIRCDITRFDEVKALMDGAAEHFGGIDVLHNNAGVHESDLHGSSTVDTLPDEIWELVFNVNIRGVFWTTKAAAPHLRASTRGPSIVNCASTGGLLGYPNSSAYCASKGAVVNFTRATAVDLAADGVRCNCYCPGSVQTPMIEGFMAAAADDPSAMSGLVGAQLIDRIGQPEEIARLVCFLASDDASFINGAVYVIDGGKLAWRGTRG
ncbi:SDR family NAD(P)-dependent oxidoreductase [Baekduia soli]|nr:SDR family oxidoreductase [Baekduia soli]